jgi:Tol biopolymer transport system component/DNA-binding winged helix-turn-helix (wHTH) protein
MLKRPSAPPPAWPTERLRVGGFEVDLRAREVQPRSGGAARRITAKAASVLGVLALQRGEVVTREELMDVVWPQTFPTGDVLTQAVTQLRKAFGDDADTPRYVATIAKSGYRLIAEVEWLQKDSAVPATATVGAGEGLGNRGAARSRAPWWFAGGVLATAALALLAWQGSMRRITAAPAPEIVRLTSTPGFERSPRLSPDGSVIVYTAAADDAAHTALYLQSSTGFTARRLTAPRNGSDTAPAWSPDGRRVAFRRVRERDACTIVTISISTGEEREIAPCLPLMFGLDWSPDGRWLATGARVEPYGKGSHLQRLDIEAGRWEPVSYTRPDGAWDGVPRYSPDGRRLLFRRGTSTADLWQLELASGEAGPLTRLGADLRGHDWWPDGRGVTFGLVDVRGLHLMHLPSGEDQPIDSGVRGAGVPDLAGTTMQAVFELPTLGGRLWRRELNASPVPPLEAFPSVGESTLPAVSPDARFVAFYSDRSGQLRVWTGARATRDGARPVEGFTPFPRFPPAWHDDGERLLAVGEGAQGEGVYELEPARGRAHRIVLDGAQRVELARYLDDGRILVLERAGETSTLAVFDATGRRLASGTVPVSYAVPDPRRHRVLYSTPRAAGVFATGIELRGETRVVQGFVHPPNYRGWDVAGDVLLVVGLHPGESPLWRFDLAAPDRPPEAAGAVPDSYLKLVALEPAGDAAWFADESEQGIDIGRAELRPPR